MSRGLGWSFVSTLLTAVGSLFITPLLVHTLGPSEFGIYSLVLVFASYFGFFDFGLTWAATRYFAEDLARADGEALASRLRTLQIFLLVIGGFCILASVSVGPIIMRAAGASSGPRMLAALLIGSISFTLALQIQLYGALLRAGQHFVRFGRAAALGSALLPLGSYAVIRLGHGLLALLAVNAAVNLIVLAVYRSYSRRTRIYQSKTGRFKSSYLHQMAAFGGWSTVSRLVMTIMLQMDRLAVALVGQVSGLTYYAVPANLASRVNLLGGPTANLFFARASSLCAEDSKLELERQHSSAVRFLVWSAIALGVPLIAVGPSFLSVWISPEMAHRGGPILIAFVIGYSLVSVGSLYAVTIEASGRVDWTAKNMLFWAVPVTLAVVTGIRHFGFLAIGFGVSGWLCCVALTNIAICRRIVSTEIKNGWLGGLGTVALALVVGVTLRVQVTNVITGIASMSLVGLVASTVGFIAILSRSDRALISNLTIRPLWDFRRSRTSERKDIYVEHV